MSSEIVRKIDEALMKPSKGKKKHGASPATQDIVRKVVNKLREGESQLKHLLEHGFTIYQVIWAIKNHKCISNLGSTYLEQTVAGTIRDLIKDGALRPHLVDQYRRIFGLPAVRRVNDKAQRPKGGGTAPLTHNAVNKLNKILRHNRG